MLLLIELALLALIAVVVININNRNNNKKKKNEDHEQPARAPIAAAARNAPQMVGGVRVNRRRNRCNLEFYFI